MDVRALHRHLGAFVRPLADALLPVQCPGCGAWDVTLCQACAALARGTPEWHVLDGEGEVDDLPLWSLGAYAGSLRRLVLAAKHRPHVDLLGFLDRCGETLGASLVCSPLMVGEQVWVVPAPSGWRRRHLDQMVAPALALGVARGIAGAPGRRGRGRVVVVDALRLRVGAGTQSTRSAGQRRSGRAGAMRCVVDVPAGTCVVLVDDVVTTGATVREGARVLGGGEILVAALCRVG